MVTAKKYLHLQTDDIVHEYEAVRVLVPENVVETDFLLHWMKHELQEDLAAPPDEVDLIGKFFRTVSYVGYRSNGLFEFVSPDSKTRVEMYIHPYVPYSPSDEEDAAPPPHEFELIWVKGGIAYSLYEQSVIEDLMKTVE